MWKREKVLLRTFVARTRRVTRDICTLRELRMRILILVLLIVNSCLDSPNHITIFDGRNDQSPVIGQFCSNKRTVQLISSGSDLYIEFVSGPPNINNDYVPNYGGSLTTNNGVSSGFRSSQGFRAYYKFIPDPIRTSATGSTNFGRISSGRDPKSGDKNGNPNSNWNIPSTEPDPNQVYKNNQINNGKLLSRSLSLSVFLTQVLSIPFFVYLNCLRTDVTKERKVTSGNRSWCLICSSFRSIVPL